MHIENGTKWLYIGDEGEFGLVHTVMQVEIITDPEVPYIVTWSDVYQDEEPQDGSPDGTFGVTWRGPIDDFIGEFVSLGEEDEAGV